MSHQRESRGDGVVLFVEGLGPTSRNAIRCLTGIDWPPGSQPAVVDVTRSRELADWYGIVRFPAVAVVEDGMLVAIEHECTEPACRRLLAAARARAPLVRQRQW